MKVFDQYWFVKYQKIILMLANSQLGNIIFGFKTMGHYIENRIVKITPNSVHECDNNKIKAHFFSRNEYARRLYFALLPMWWLMHGWDMLIANQLSRKLSFGFDTLTVYPDAHPETNTVDGRARQTYGVGAGVDWSVIRAAAGSTATDTETAGEVIQILSDNVEDKWRINSVGILLFYTESLGGSANISNAECSFVCSSKADALNITPDINIYSSAPATDTALVAGDYDSVGTVAFSTSMAYADVVADDSTYNAFTLNATGISAISQTATPTKFGFRNANYDVAAQSPVWSSAVQSYINIRFADNGSNKPKLVITYSTNPTITGISSITGISTITF